MKLYWSPTSPYVRKVSVVAHELGIELEREKVAVHDLANNDYGKVNPVNRIPALRLDDGTMLWDSRLICEYLDASKGRKLLPADGAERWRILNLQVLGDGILDAGVPRMAERSRPKEQQNQARLDEYVRSVHQTLAHLESITNQLGGVNLGTIAVGCALGYLDFRYADEPWRPDHPKLAAWFEEFARRPSMLATVPQA